MKSDLQKTPARRGWARKLTLIFLGVSLAAGIANHYTPSPANGSQPQPTPVTETVTPSLPPAPVAAPYVSQTAGVPDSSRELTAGERQLAQRLFGYNDLDLNGVRLHFFKAPQGDGVSNVAPGDGKNIEIYGVQNASADFSAEKDPFNYSTFVYEMTRLWQNQQGDYLHAGKAEGHEYVLKEELDFISYGKAQQRAMMEDYALRFFHPSHATHWLPKTTKGADSTDTDGILRSLVENQFPEAKAARLWLRDTYARDMTASEKAFVMTFFEGYIRTTDGVKLYMYPFAAKGSVASVESGYGVNFWGAAQHDADYTTTKNAEHFATFIHEMNHITQNQSGQRFTPNQTARQYRYWLDAKSTFTDFSIEQQSAMVEDYAMYFLHPSKAMSYMPSSYSKDQFPEKTQQLKKIVEAQFPGAKKLREAYEAKQMPKAKLAPAMS